MRYAISRSKHIITWVPVNLYRVKMQNEMLTIKASYKNGRITLIEPMPDKIKNAKLTIVVEPVDEPEKMTIPAQEYAVMAKDSETEYQLIGLNSFFDNENDKNIDWEDYFGFEK